MMIKNKYQKIERKARSGCFGDRLNKNHIIAALLLELSRLESQGGHFTYFKPAKQAGRAAEHGPHLRRADLVVISARGQVLYLAAFCALHAPKASNYIGEVRVRAICALSVQQARAKLRKELERAGIIDKRLAEQTQISGKSLLSPIRDVEKLFSGALHV